MRAGTRSAILVGALGAGFLGFGAAQSQPPGDVPASLPFAVGEELVYRVKLGPLGGGEGTMRVAGPEAVRGTQAWILSFDVKGRVALAGIEDRARSWVDPTNMATLRYEKRERSPLASHDEAVDIFPAERRWENAAGASGATPCIAPLDELSFIYYIRTLDFDRRSESTFHHHFDPDRNPVRVRLVDRKQVTVPAGTFSTLVVEMEVRDERRYGGTGIIRLFLTDDEHRIPVRVESPVPVVGSAVLTLQRWTPGGSSAR